MRKRTILALLVSLAVFGSLYVMAATLGGITSSKVGADNTVVASCDTDGVTTSYATSWDATDKRYEITSVTVAGVADTCDGETLSVSLTDSTGAQIGTGSVAIPSSAATSFAVSMSTAASAKLTEGVNVLIA
jgi:uncharacterized membrane-anchored protein